MRWRFPSLMVSPLVVSLASIALPSLAFAQPSPPTSSGPMTVERMHNGWFAAGDVKLTEVDHRTSELVGGQAGRVFDDALFVGGAGYWLANGSRDREMAYGGLVIQYLVRGDRRVSFGARALIGGGQATLSENIFATVRTPDLERQLRALGLDPGRLPATVASAIVIRPTTVRFRENFFVVEPEATASLKLASHLRLTGGVGYRAVTTQDRVDSRLRGATGTLGIQIS